MSRVVLFGECGFVGSNLLSRLQDRDIVAPTLAEADFTRPESLRSVLRPGDVVVNAAGYAEATDTSPRGRALFQAVNVDGVKNLADACREAGVEQLVHISSVAAMGRWHADNVTEDMLKPVNSPYAQSKLDGEKILAEYAGTLPVTILRPTSVFGEGRGLAATLCRMVAKGTIPLPSGGRARIPFTYIGNIAFAVGLSLGNANCYGRTFVIGDKQSYALRDVVLELARALDTDVRIVPVPASAAFAAARGFEALARIRGSKPLIDRGRVETMTASVSFSIAAFQQATGYEPPFGLGEAADRIASWFRESRRQEGEN